MITNIKASSWNQKLSGLQALVVQRLDNPIHQINLYTVDNTIRFAITCPLDDDLDVIHPL